MQFFKPWSPVYPFCSHHFPFGIHQLHKKFFFPDLPNRVKMEDASTPKKPRTDSQPAEDHNLRPVHKPHIPVHVFQRRTCSKCGKPTASHPLPVGKNCTLEPDPQQPQCSNSTPSAEHPRKCSRHCSKCGRPCAGHPLPLGTYCTLEPVPKSNPPNQTTATNKHYKKAWTSPMETTQCPPFKIPKMDTVCAGCGAFMFPWETSKSTSSGKVFSACCHYGSIQLVPFKDPPPALQELFSRTSPQSRQFLDNIRQYNGLVSMASKNITGKLIGFTGHGPQPFKMSGQMYHLTPSSIFPDEGKKPKFSQMFVFDQENELNNRLHQAKDPQAISQPTLELLQTQLKRINPLVKSFQSAADVFNTNPTKKLKMVRINRSQKEIPEP